jgi:hypothetical protein
MRGDNFLKEDDKYDGWSQSMGHEIGILNNEWVYCDTDEKIDEVELRACSRCKLYPTPEGHDPCIANLKGVTNACCGHGIEDGYVQLENGLVIRGQFDHIKYPHLYE